MDDEIPCMDIVPPASGEGPDCLVEVTFIYTITNDGNEVERIYAVTVTRGTMTTVLTDVPDLIPTVDLAPGESIVVPVVHEIDVCAGDDAFDTKITVLAGPPCDVEVGALYSRRIDELQCSSCVCLASHFLVYVPG